MSIWVYIGFILLILIMLTLDLGLAARRSRAMGFRAALLWSAWWIFLALLFDVAVYFIYSMDLFGAVEGTGLRLGGTHAALQFLTAYIVEETLSLDNIFVIALIFAYMQVPPKYQHRTLIWGILGALVLRGIMIALGALLLQKFSWFTYVFGGLLILTAIRLLVAPEGEMELSRNPLVRLARRFYPVTPDFRGERFFTRLDGRRAITPLFLVLLLVASCDVIFAVDSIPAVFGVTQEPFIVFTSNVFAVLGWRSLYFALAALLHLFRYLKISLVFVLGFVGVKMVSSHFLEIPTGLSLGVVSGILVTGIAASLYVGHRERKALYAPEDSGLFGDVALKVWRQARRVAVLVIGTSVVLVGIALLVLPGPAFVVIPAGLAILSLEFVWARRLLAKAKQKALELSNTLRKPAAEEPRASEAPCHAKISEEE